MGKSEAIHSEHSLVEYTTYRAVFSSVYAKNVFSSYYVSHKLRLVPGKAHLSFGLLRSLKFILTTSFDQPLRSLCQECYVDS